MHILLSYTCVFAHLSVAIHLASLAAARLKVSRCLATGYIWHTVRILGVMVRQCDKKYV